MEKIYSTKEDGVLLAIIVKFQDFNQPRNEIVPPEEFLQGAAMRVNEGEGFRPHRHIWKSHWYDEIQTQECWIVIRGAIKVFLYDLDNNLLDYRFLIERDAIFLLHGGHTFECLEDHTCVYELKTGPYEGQARDKVFLDEKG
jgi:hypothetical protein